MEIGHFYFLKDEYFDDFPDNGLMSNHETVDGIAHNRPCIICIFDENTNTYWAVPISSKVEKYKRIYKSKTEKYGVCDTIVFGNVLGREKAFLIQNMCPITEKYVKNEYVYDGNPVKIDKISEEEILRKSKKVLSLLTHKNINLIFPDVLNILRKITENE